MYKVCCVIVTYNGMKWIDKCISSIDEKNIDLTIVVVDNNSSDGTTEFIKTNFPKVKILQQKQNLGFGGANNLGYEAAKDEGAQYVYLLNQDTISYPDNIYNLIEKSKNIDKIGVVSPIHLNEEGNLFDASFEEYITAKTCKNYISDVSLGNVQSYYELGFINAAAWLIKVEVVEFLGGLFSPAFYHYGEDVNFIGRLRYFNFKNVIVPGVFIHHCRSARIGGVSKEFQNKIVEINKVNIMHDIKNSYFSCYKNVLKYAMQQFTFGKFGNSLSLLLYPIFQYNTIKRYRNSYIERKIQKL